MNMHIRIAKAAIAVTLAAMAYTAKAESSDSGASPFEPGHPAMVYLSGPEAASDGEATPPLSQQNLGPAAIASISAPNIFSDGGATGDIRLAHNQDQKQQMADSGFVSGTR